MSEPWRPDNRSLSRRAADWAIEAGERERAAASTTDSSDGPPPFGASGKGPASSGSAAPPPTAGTSAGGGSGGAAKPRPKAKSLEEEKRELAAELAALTPGERRTLAARLQRLGRTIDPRSTP